MLPNKRLIACVLTTFGWILMVVTLAEKKSMYTRQGGGCGVYECESHPPDNLRYPDDDVCSERRHHARTIQAFATMGAILMSFEVLIHVAGVVAPSKVPASVTGVVANLHLVSAVVVLVAWCTMVGLYASVLCGWALRELQSSSVGYGVFFLISITCSELTCMFISKALVKEAYPMSPI